MSRKNILFILALLVLVAVFGWQWKADHAFVDLVEQVDTELDPSAQQFFEDQSAVWQEAIAAYEEIGEQPDLNLYILVAFNARHRGDLALAKETYEQYFTYHQLNYAAYADYADLLRQMGDLQGAKEAYQTAITLQPKQESLYHGLARVLTQAGEEERIGDLYQDALDEVGRTRSLLVVLAEWYADQGECEKAISHYEVAIQLAEDEGIAEAVRKDLQAVETTCKE